MENNKAGIPLVSSDKEKTENQSLKKVPFAVSEAYKSIRTNLVSVLAKQNSKTLVISSPNASEGKSTTSINIAISLSQINKKVLLIDTDLHRPSIHAKLKMKNNDGIMNVLSGVSTFNEAVQQYNSKLDVLTTGPIPQNATEIFSDPSLAALFDELNEKYDYIILDTPPVNILSDSLVIAQKTAGIIFVVRAGITTHEALRRALSSVKQLDINILGVILNGCDYGKSKYYKKYYSSYYN